MGTVYAIPIGTPLDYTKINTINGVPAFTGTIIGVDLPNNLYLWSFEEVTDYDDVPPDLDSLTSGADHSFELTKSVAAYGYKPTLSSSPTPTPEDGGTCETSCWTTVGW